MEGSINIVIWINANEYEQTLIDWQFMGMYGFEIAILPAGIKWNSLLRIGYTRLFRRKRKYLKGVIFHLLWIRIL